MNCHIILDFLYYENKVGVGRTNFKRVEIKALVSEALASGIKLESVKHEADRL